MPLHKIDALLSASGELKALSARTRQLKELQKLFFRTAPRELAVLSRVKNYRAGTLLISADDAAVATKLRQLAPTLLASIREAATEITALRIEVQVIGRVREPHRESKKIALSAGALEKLDELASRVSNGELRSALTRLVRRHRTSKR